MDKDDSKSKERRDEIALWFKEHKTQETEELMRQFLEDGVTDIAAEVQDIRRQITDEDYRLLPISYIATKYFGKSHAWLSQRINGTKVRGRVYTLNPEQQGHARPLEFLRLVSSDLMSARMFINHTRPGA